MYDHNENQNISFFHNDDNNLEDFQLNNPITTTHSTILEYINHNVL